MNNSLISLSTIVWMRSKDTQTHFFLFLFTKPLERGNDAFSMLYNHILSGWANNANIYSNLCERNKFFFFSQFISPSMYGKPCHETKVIVVNEKRKKTESIIAWLEKFFEWKMSRSIVNWFDFKCKQIWIRTRNKKWWYIMRNTDFVCLHIDKKKFSSDFLHQRTRWKHWGWHELYAYLAFRCVASIFFFAYVPIRNSSSTLNFKVNHKIGGLMNIKQTGWQRWKEKKFQMICTTGSISIW